MELKPRERKEVDIHYLDEETGLHIKVQEVSPRGEKKEGWFSVSVHIEGDIHYNSFDLACPTEEAAREAAEKSFEFFKSIKPLLSVKIRDNKGEDACHY